MTIQQAIEKAVEGGYAPNAHEPEETHISANWVRLESEGGLNGPDYMRPEIFLNTLFWQSLGKAMGWDDVYAFDWRRCGLQAGGGLIKGSERKEEWEYHWHRFIDHLAEGKDAESFFKEL